MFKSNLNLTEFQNKLTENTKIGNPRFKYSYGLLSIFIFDSRYFFGNFKNSSFELTINSNFSPHIYMIVSKYECIDKELVINYKLESISKSHVFWFKYFPFISIILFNFVMITQENTPIEVYLIFNGFIVFIYFFSKWSIKRRNKRMLKKFHKIFEIIQ